MRTHRGKAARLGGAIALLLSLVAVAAPSAGGTIASDQTATLVLDAYPGADSANPSILGPLGEHLLFVAETPQGAALHRTDGTPAGTELVKRFDTRDPNVRSQAAVDGAWLFFIGVNDASELWRTDGTEAGTERVASFYSGYGLVGAGDRAYFGGAVECCDDGELWITNGTEAGTMLLPGPAGSVSGIVPFADGIAFTTSDGLDGYQLWVSDGTEVGPRRLAELGKSSFGLPPDLTATDTQIFALQRNKTSGQSELWVSDGTEAGSRMEKEFGPAAVGIISPGGFIGQAAYDGGLTPIGDKAYFRAIDGENGLEPWVSDGTADGTFPLADTAPGSEHGRGYSFAAAGEVVVFNGGASGEVRLWQTDGTPDGAQLVNDVTSGIAESPSSLTTVGELVIFSASQPAFNQEVWVTDGSASGTRLVADVEPSTDPNPGSYPQQFTPFAGRVFFTAQTEAAGRELWSIVAVTEGPCSPATITHLGTEGDDEIMGTNGPDIIVALGGDDKIWALGGDDVVCAGAGNDRVFGGAGNDGIYGGPGIDKIRGGPDTDEIMGGPSLDFLKGGTGNDVLWGDGGPDRLRGGTGFDTVFGGDGPDVLWGGPGHDELLGQAGNDILKGSDGIDRCDGGTGIDFAKPSCEFIADVP